MHTLPDTQTAALLRKALHRAHWFGQEFLKADEANYDRVHQEFVAHIEATIAALPEPLSRAVADDARDAASEMNRLRQSLISLQEAAKDAPDILESMIATSKTACPPMHYLLTHDGLYGFHMANLWVRNDGKEYTMEADWADNCGKLVKRLTEVLMRLGVTAPVVSPQLDPLRRAAGAESIADRKAQP